MVRDLYWALGKDLLELHFGQSLHRLNSLIWLFSVDR